MPVTKVLIVDDADFIHKLVRAHLSTEPVEVRSAFDGGTGLAAAAEFKPDLILLDLDMPDMNGIAVYRGLKADAATRGCSVVFLTADSSSLTGGEASGLGVLDYISKPFNGDVLRGRVGAVKSNAA